jgi:6-phosphofructokinase 2
MIYTLTMNPSLDRTIDVEEFIYDDVNTIVEEKEYVSGKGIDVSRVIKELGGQSIALGIVGGYSGLELEGRLVNEGVLCDFTRVNAETRTNIIIHQRKKKMQTFLSTPGPHVSPLETATIFNKLKDLPRGSHLVISGSLPPDMSETFFAQIITTVRDKDISVFLDTDGETLKNGVQARPYLIKPNIHEFNRLAEKNMKDVEELCRAAEPYLEFIDRVVISAGARGAVGVSRQERYHVVPPKVNVKSSMGAGDSLLAGFIFALNEGASFKDALALGVACGTAATLNPMQALCVREDVYQIRKEVVIKSID